MNAPTWPTREQDTDPVRPGRASSAAFEHLPDGFIETLANPPPHLADGPIMYVEPAEPLTATMYDPTASPTELEIRQRRMEKHRAAWAPIPEIGGYMWDVWRDHDDPTIQVAAPANRTRFMPQTNRPGPTALRTDEAVGKIPPWGMRPAHELRAGHVVLAGFGYATVSRISHGSDGRVAIRLELPPSLILLPYPAVVRGPLSPYLSITRDMFDDVPVHALAAPLGSDRTIAQSPGHPY